MVHPPEHQQATTPSTVSFPFTTFACVRIHCNRYLSFTEPGEKRRERYSFDCDNNTMQVPLLSIQLTSVAYVYTRSNNMEPTRYTTSEHTRYKIWSIPGTRYGTHRVQDMEHTGYKIKGWDTLERRISRSPASLDYSRNRLIVW